jgi:hypothetical protein
VIFIKTDKLSSPLLLCWVCNHPSEIKSRPGKKTNTVTRVKINKAVLIRQESKKDAGRLPLKKKGKL